MDRKAREKDLWLQMVQEKLAEAEEDIRQGRTVDAWSALKELEEKYGL